jgi:hypothetical protein
MRQPATDMSPVSRPVLSACAGILGVALLAGCDPLALTAFGVGASTGVQHTLNGVTYKTFTTPLPQVRTAAMSGLNRMGIKVVSRGKKEGGEVIKASATERTIEIELDAITPNTTRMRAAVRNGILMDSATGTEIILQTERALSGKGAST